MSGEIERKTVTNQDFPLEVTCPNCEREIVLYFNGGELDYNVCCGLRYELEHTRIDFIVKKEEVERK